MEVNLHTGLVTPFRLRDPVLRYRLDPCEPGILDSAPASQSIAAVSAHERGNLSQFRREAALAGRMIINESITFTRGVDGMFTSIRAGRTEVVSVPLPEADIPSIPETDEPEIPRPLEQPQPESNDVLDSDKQITNDELELLTILSTIRKQLEGSLIPEHNPQDASTDLTPPAEPASDEYIIPQQLPPEENESLTQPLSGDEPPPTRVQSTPSYEPLSPPAREIEREEINREENRRPSDAEYARMQAEMRDVQHQLNELMIKRLGVNISQLNEVLSGAISQNIDMASKLVKVVNHIGPYSRFPDVSSQTPLLGAALDFHA